MTKEMFQFLLKCLVSMLPYVDPEVIADSSELLVSVRDEFIKLAPLPEVVASPPAVEAAPTVSGNASDIESCLSTIKNMQAEIISLEARLSAREEELSSLKTGTA